MRRMPNTTGVVMLGMGKLADHKFHLLSITTNFINLHSNNKMA